MITVENNIGRLIEIRQTGRITINDLTETGPLFGRILGAIGGKAVLCTDWRGMQILPQKVASVLLDIIKSDNERVERQGVLLDPSALIGMQLDRLLRSAGKMDTMSFRDSGKMQDWLGKVLTLSEKTQMRKFLGRE